MKFKVFWVVTLKLTDVSEEHTVSRAMKDMEEVRTSETSVNFKVTTRRYIPEASKLQLVICLVMSVSHPPLSVGL
jgi:hypothetical protein